MPELRWFEVHPPRELTHDNVTAMLRVLAGRPRFGLQKLQPLAVVETWVTRDQVRWLLGCDERIARHLPGELAAQAPGMTFTAVKDSPRQAPVTAREVSVSNLTFPLRQDTAGAVAAGVIQQRHRLGKAERLCVQWVIGPSQSASRRPTEFTPLETLGIVPPRKPEAEERQAWREKLAEPLLGVRGRVGAVASDPKRAAQLIGPVISALSLASGTRAKVRAGRQSSRVADQLIRVIGRTRTWSSFVNASELAALAAYPVDGVTIPGAELAVHPPPRSLLVPADKPEQAEGDRIVGHSIHPQSKGTLVRMPVRSCFGHVHLVSPTGAGKSTILARWVLSDIRAGRSVFVLEPKNDLLADIAGLVPNERQNDVVVIQPGSGDMPVTGINPLAGPREDAERRADSLLGSFRSVFGSAIGPRSADVLLHSLIALARLDDGCLTDLPIFLTNDNFRRKVLAKVTDPLTLAPWAASFESFSDIERQRVVMPILNKTRAFTARSHIRRMLGQPQPLFNLDTLFREPKIVLVALNSGVIGRETSRLLGSIVLTQFWEAIQRQATIPKAERRPVMAIVDELADFASSLDFAEVLAKARGMNTGFTVAHQLLTHLNPTLRAAVLGNCRSRVSMQPAKKDSGTLAETFGGGITGENLMRLPAYHAMAQVLLDGVPSAPFTVSMPNLPEATEDAAAVLRASAEHYGVDPVELDKQLITRWGGGDEPEGPIGTRRKQ